MVQIALYAHTHGIGFRDDTDNRTLSQPAASLDPVRVAQAAEAAGFHSMWFPDHVCMPAETASAHVVNASGRLETTEQFGAIVLKSGEEGAVTRLRDVARIELGSNTWPKASSASRSFVSSSSLNFCCSRISRRISGALVRMYSLSSVG